MKLTLRKANAVQSEINDAIKALDLNTQVTLNEFEDIQAQILSVRDRFWDNVSVRYWMLSALFEIRKLVAQSNASSGINDMLTRIAFLEKQIVHCAAMAGTDAQTALPVLEGNVKKNAVAKDESYGYSRRDVVTSIFTEIEIADFKSNAANHKREKQKLQDALLELNVKTEITLTNDTAEFLIKVGIL